MSVKFDLLRLSSKRLVTCIRLCWEKYFECILLYAIELQFNFFFGKSKLDSHVKGSIF